MFVINRILFQKPKQASVEQILGGIMKKAVFSLVVVLSFLVVGLGCEKATFMPKEGDNQDTEGTEATGTPLGTNAFGTVPVPSNVNAGTVAIHGKDKISNVSVEVAKTDDSKEKGLSGRESVPDNTGMLFVFDENVRDPFGTKDTLVSLDIIFIGQDLKVVDIIPNTVPNSEDQLIPNADYRYVVEVRGGYAADNGIEIGNSVELRIGPATTSGE